jgi:hypothetical protein
MYSGSMDKKTNPCPSCFPSTVIDCESQCPQCRGAGGTDLLDGYMSYCSRCAGLGHIPVSDIRWKEFIHGLSRELNQPLHLEWLQKLDEQHQRDVQDYFSKQAAQPLHAY